MSVNRIHAGPVSPPDPLLSVRRLSKRFPVREGLAKKYLRAVDGVSFELRKGQTLAIVGESGSGKSTLARMVTRLLEPSSGEIWLEHRNLSVLSKRELRRMRKDMQMVFQDPYASLNPRQRVRDIISEPFDIHRLARSKQEAAENVARLLESVGLLSELGSRYPHELSGGQRQRVAIARALAVSPKLIVFDEAVSALDVSIQAQMLNMIRDVQERFQLSYLFITHDLSVARHVATHVAVMYLGEFVEYGESERLFSNPRHPYTKALLSSVPLIGKQQSPMQIIRNADPPNLLAPFPGCRFQPRCPFAQTSCSTRRPGISGEPDGSHYWACPVDR